MEEIEYIVPSHGSFAEAVCMQCLKNRPCDQFCSRLDIQFGRRPQGIWNLCIDHDRFGPTYQAMELIREKAFPDSPYFGALVKFEYDDETIEAEFQGLRISKKLSPGKVIVALRKNNKLWSHIRLEDVIDQILKTEPKRWVDKKISKEYMRLVPPELKEKMPRELYPDLEL